MSATRNAWGELSRRDDRVCVKLKRRTDHSPARVWSMLTNSANLANWLAPLEDIHIHFPADRFREARAAFGAIVEEELAAWPALTSRASLEALKTQPSLPSGRGDASIRVYRARNTPNASTHSRELTPTPACQGMTSKAVTTRATAAS